MTDAKTPAPPPRVFCPTACPECDRIISPAVKPAPGDRASCPYCETAIVFVESGVFVRASAVAPK